MLYAENRCSTTSLWLGAVLFGIIAALLFKLIYWINDYATQATLQHTTDEHTMLI